ncbi:MAG: FAD-dependent monooxygenase [Caldilineaceae bacterium]|nr:FAD-dependent monooxygenase [Caldilineaceae bacterium]
MSVSNQVSTIMGRHAIIIGGSMAGLLTARVLSEHFARVTILERDPVDDVPEARKGQPQTRHLHALLARGLEIMTRYFPDLPEALAANGAIVGDLGDLVRWYTFGGYRLQRKTGLVGASMSRPLLEWLVRQRVLALPAVRLIDNCRVEGLVFDASQQRVAGLQIERRDQEQGLETMEADLVVDASGRGTLEAAGFGRPLESTVKVGVGYATRLYRRKPSNVEETEFFIVTGEPPHDKRSGLIFPIEGDRWICTLAGLAGDHPALDEEGFMAFARSLAAPDIYNQLVKLEPVSDIVGHKLPSSLRRHYEKMRTFPKGYLVLGDAICSFNPIYGQGMTSAAMQAEALDTLLRERPSTAMDGLAKEFFQRAARIVDIPWQLAVGADFQYPETEGKKAMGTDLINAYVTKVHRATQHDPVVYQEFLKVMNLIQPPASLFHPRIVGRVLRPRRIPVLRPAFEPVAGD